MKAHKILIAIGLVICLSLSAIGYAEITDTLSVTGSAQVLKQPKIIDYMYVSEASVNNGSEGDRIAYMDGSNDYTNQFGYFICELDFSTSRTKTVELTLTNKSSARLAYYKYDITVNMGEGTVSSSSVSGLKVLPNDDYPDLEGGFNEETSIVGVPEDKLNSTNEYVIGQGDSIPASISISSDSAEILNITVRFFYASPSEADKKKLEGDATINAASDKLEAVLNSEAGAPKNYDQIIQQMKDASYQDNYVGNVIGASTSDTAFVKAIFGDTLQSVSIGGGESKPCTVMIKKKNVTGTYAGDEFVLFLTADNPSNPESPTTESWFGDYILVSAIVYVKGTDGKWVRYGGIYTGEARVNNYTGGLGASNSFNTETWRAYGAQSFSTVEPDGTTKQYTISDNDSIDACISSFEKRK